MVADSPQQLSRPDSSQRSRVAEAASLIYAPYHLSGAVQACVLHELTLSGALTSSCLGFQDLNALQLLTLSLTAWLAMYR